MQGLGANESLPIWAQHYRKRGNTWRFCNPIWQEDFQITFFEHWSLGFSKVSLWFLTLRPQDFEIGPRWRVSGHLRVFDVGKWDQGSSLYVIQFHTGYIIRRNPNLRNSIPRWWFQIFLIITPTWGADPIWLDFFKWVETTNKIHCFQWF